jgi:hypothetical protein
MATRPDSRQVVLRSTQTMLGSGANDTLDTIFPKINDEIAKLFEDRNILLTQGGLITFTGTQVEFTESLSLVINQKVSGAVPQIISLGSTTRLFTNSGDMLVAVVDRSAGTGTLSVITVGNPIPAVSSLNQEVFLIAVRYDATDGTQRLYWRTGMAMNAGQTIRLGSSGTGGGSGLGDDLITTQFQASFTDEFSESPTTSSSAVNPSITNAEYSAAKALYKISYDASNTVTGTGTSMTLSSAPAFTIVEGDVLIVSGEARTITAITSQTVFTIESAFTTNPTASLCNVSQAVHSKDVYNTAFDGSAISSAFSTSFSEILVDYEDTTTVGDDIFDINTAPVVGFSASPDGTSWTAVGIRPTSPLTQLTTTNLPSSGSALYLRLFANKSSGSGTVNVLRYKAYMQKLAAYSSGGVLNSALAFTNSAGTEINCSVGLSGGKTAVTLTWTYPVGINPTTSNGALEVYLNGQKIPRYVDAGITPDSSYTELSPTIVLLDRDYSAYNLSVEIVLPSVYIDQSSQNSTNIAVSAETMGEGFQAFVKNSLRLNPTTTTGTPASGRFYSSVVNRAAIVDITQDLRASFGVERIMTQQIYQLQDELGSNGEPVFGASNDDRGLIRFVGAGWTNNTNLTFGTGPNFTTANDYCEITFYGTGLNFLVANGPSASVDFRVSVDGGAEGSNIMPATSTLSGVIGSRNYAPNQVINAISGLSLGVHTVKIRSNATVTWTVHGFEVLNTSSTTSINVNSGTSYIGGSKLTALTASSLPYNSTFESGTLGSKGGRVLVYQKSNGAIAKAVTPTNTAVAYLSSADHTNEEIARTYHWREFGAGRSDDFSSTTTNAANAVFTLDDGTTTLVATSACMYGGGVFSNSSSGFITFTFVGTGLDIYFDAAASTLSATTTLYVDGVSQGPVTSSNMAVGKFNKVVSGLPYGTHTVKFLNSSAGSHIVINKLVVYQPKKPTLPERCVELADYNVMANYLSGIVSANIDALSTGIIHKQCSREAIYVGTWAIASPSTNVIGGQFVSSSTLNNYVEYTFFGTGLNIIASSGTTTIQIDGSSYTGSATAVGTGSSWNPVTSTWVGASVNGAGLIITGLSLGLHKVRVTLSVASAFYLHAFHIITPIYSHRSNVSYDQQNTLPVGSCSLSDDRKLSPIKDAGLQKKNIAQAVGVANSPTTSSASDVPCPDLSVTHTNTSGKIKISYSAIASNNTAGAQTAFRIYINGATASSSRFGMSYQSGATVVISDIVFANVPVGVNKIDVYWRAAGGQSTAQGDARTLLVEEV